MTDYSKMSDAEINQEVTCTLNPEAKRMPLIADGSCFYDCGPDGSGFFEIAVRDYCNSWADAGPIIHKAKINVVWGYDDLWGRELFTRQLSKILIHAAPQ